MTTTSNKKRKGDTLDENAWKKRQKYNPDFATYIPRHEDDDFSGENVWQKWKRPAVDWDQLQREPYITFQQTRTDWIVQAASDYPESGLSDQYDYIPVLRTFGVTREGHSVCLHASGFLPYIYVEAHQGRTSPDDVERLRCFLEDAIEKADDNQRKYRNNDMALEKAAHQLKVANDTPASQILARLDDKKRLYNRRAIHSITVEQRKTARQYQKGLQPFYKITLTLPHYVPALRNLINRHCLNVWESAPTVVEGHQSYGYHMRNQSVVGRHLDTLTYEDNIVFEMRYMVDVGMSGTSWIQVKTETAIITPKEDKITRCQIELRAFYDQPSVLYHRSNDPAWDFVAPMRVLSYDIECHAPAGLFPTHERDPIIQIANALALCPSVDRKEPIHKVLLTRRGCAPIDGSEVYSFGSESDMLRAQAKLIRAMDPDIITGFNTDNFDFPYVFGRAKTLKIPELCDISRVRGYASSSKPSTFSSSAHGNQQSNELRCTGRTSFDCLKWVKRNFKLRTYTLNAVSQEFLGERKEDVHHSQIGPLDDGDDEDRKRLGIYCLKDAHLPLRVLGERSAWPKEIEICRIVGVQFFQIMGSGQTIRVIRACMGSMLARNIVIPNEKAGKFNERQEASSEEEGYEGAVVLQPKAGFYDAYVATLDFASLYPSIIMAYNLCPTTHITPDRAATMDPADYIKTPAGHHFVRPHVHRGVVPQILVEILDARARARAALEASKDPVIRANYDIRQLMLKVTANSTYGALGASNSQLYTKAVAESVTSYGRDMIEATKNITEQTYCRARGYDFDANVIYGDTDSIMIVVPCDVFSAQALRRLDNPIRTALCAAEKLDSTKEDCLDAYAGMRGILLFGKNMARNASSLFDNFKPLSMAFEKIYYPYLLIKKKRYAGMFWTKPAAADKMDAKGLELVRRETVPFTVNTQKECLRLILRERSIEQAWEYARRRVQDLRLGRVELFELIVTKQLNKTAKNYATSQAHAELNERIKKRSPGSEYNLGDRIRYVMRAPAYKNQPAYERAEDPLYVLENDLPLDIEGYFDGKFANPIAQLFIGKFGSKEASVEALKKCDYKLQIKVPPVTKQKGTIAFYYSQVLSKCKTCYNKVSNPKDMFCSTCLTHNKDGVQQVIIHAKETRDAAQAKYRETCQTCWTCQSNPVDTPILCTACECPEFYKRVRARKAHAQAEQDYTKLADFSW